MTNKTIVITGANRGIGLSLCKHYKGKDYTVYAVFRHTSTELENLGVEFIEGIDVSKAKCIAQLKEQLQGVSIDILINNAGILRNEILGCIDYDSIQQQFQVNALGPLKISEALKDQFATAAKLVLITSRMGSLADNTSGGRYGYRMSKAALNIAGISLAHDLKSQGVAVAILHPGLVSTEMIGRYGDINPDQAATRLAQRIEDLTLATSGSFWHSNGEELPW